MLNMISFLSPVLYRIVQIHDQLRFSKAREAESWSNAEMLKELRVTEMRQDFAFSQLDQKHVQDSSGKNKGEIHY